MLNKGNIYENGFNTTNIKSFQINNLFKRMTVKLDFQKEVNIFVGENGLGKTTILNCLYYLLNRNYDKLLDIDFDSIEISFGNEKILLEYNEISEYNLYSGVHSGFLEMQLRNRTRHKTLSIDDDAEIEELAMYFSRREEISFSKAKSYIKSFIRNDMTISKKSINKENKINKFNNIIESMIKEKILYLPTYRRIENDIFEVNRKKMLLEDDSNLMRFGMSDVDKLIDNILSEIRKNTVESYNKMTGILLSEYSEGNKDLERDKQMDFSQVQIILDRLADLINIDDKNKILKLVETGKIYDKKFNYLYDLINKLMDNYESQKDYDNRINSFANTCNKYLKGKRFVYDQSELNLNLVLDSKEDKNIKTTQLSSGEKQIVSIFARLYLELENDVILIIDEPELSLSIIWQRMLLPDIMKSKKCKLLITVTHSPYIFENEFDFDTREISKFISANI